MQAMRLRSRFHNEHLNNEMSHRDMYVKAVEEGQNEDMVINLISQVPDRVASKKMAPVRFIIIFLLAISALAQVSAAVLFGFGGEKLIPIAFIIEALITSMFAWLVYRNYRVAYFMLICLSMTGLSRKLNLVKEGEMVGFISLGLVLIIDLLALIMLLTQYKHCSKFLGKRTIADGEEKGFWDPAVAPTI